MNWLTWRQYRAAALAGYAALGAVGLLLVVTGMKIYDQFASSGLERCLGIAGEDCDALATALTDRFSGMTNLFALLLFMPALLGVFWGAPLVARELEHGTHRLVWTQGITRTRWLRSKLAIVGLSTALASGAIAWAMNWWSGPFVTAHRWLRIDYGNFDMLGIVPVAYALFAFAFGVAAGAVLGKTLPAAFATMAGYAAVRIPIATFLRERYMSPLSSLTPLDPTISKGSAHARDWVLSENIVDKFGTVVGQHGTLDLYVDSVCPVLGSKLHVREGVDAAAECIRNLGLQVSEVYHPAGRFWTFQWIEAAIFIGLAAVLIAFVIWRVKRVN